MGESVWKQEFHEKGASYIAFHFSRIEIQNGDYLIVRNPENTRFWKYTYAEVEAKGNSFWSIHIYGEDAVIEIFSENSSGAFGYEIDKIAKGFAIDSLPFSPRAICGNDDSENAICYQSTEPCVYEHSRAVARLLINGVSACTGWLLGDDGHLITNEHCIANQSDANNTTYEFMAEGTNCTSNCNAWLGCPGVIEATSATLERVNAGLDYALLKLPTNVSNVYGFLRLRPQGAQLEERIYIPQHPSGWGKRIALFSSHPNDAGGFARIQSLTEPACSSSSYNDIGYFADTRGGSSGSPVIAYNDNLVVALHHCANCPNRGVPIQLIINDLGDDLPPNSITTLTGPVALCSSGTYAITNLPAGASVTGWSASPSSAVTLSGSGNSRTVTKAGTYTGLVTLNVTVTGPCGSLTISREIQVGAQKPDPPTWSYNAPPGRVRLSANPVAGATSYQWYRNGNLVGTSTNTHYDIPIAQVPCGNYYYFGVRAVGECGLSDEAYTFADVQCEAMFTVYPNPASETLTVAMGSEAKRGGVPDKAAMPKFEAVLYDGTGRQFRQGESKEGVVQFDTRQLPAGTYFLHIHHNGEVEKRQVVIRH